MVAPTVYGGNRLFHRNRGITQFTVGADSISARLFRLNRLHTGHVGISQAMQNLLRKYLDVDPYGVLW